MLGRTVGNYVVKEKLGEGGMGAVFVAQHPQLGKRAAVKVLKPELVQSPELVARFFHEARAASSIQNPHIVEVFDFGQLEDGSSYITMEWLDGRSLSAVLRDAGRLPLERTAHIIDGIARALEAAHAHGIVHRDLKPDNVVLVSRDGDPDFVKVLDFGIAKLMDGSVDVKTQTGAILGTPHYMAPEQCNGAAVDTRTDVYALGVVAYQLLTGRLPFERGGLAQILMAHVSEAPPKPRSLTSDVPPHIEAAILQALEKDPAQRFQTPAAFARALQSPSTVAMASSPVAASSGVAASSPVVAAPSSKSRTMAIGAGVLLLVAIIGATLLFTRKTPPNESVSYSGSWTLSKSTCGFGVMPQKVIVTQNGSDLVIEEPGFPDTTGTIDAQGRYTVKNSRGVCKGQVSGQISTETCSNAFGSCRATYRAQK